MNRFQLLWQIIIVVAFSSRLLAADVLHQDLDVNLIPSARQVTVTAELALGKSSPQWPEEFFLAAHAVIEQVSAEGDVLPYSFTDGHLSVADLAEKSTLTIKYHVVFADPVPEDFVGMEDPSYGVTATILPEGTYLSEASGWHPQARGFANDFTVSIVGPGGLTGVTSGRLQAYDSDGSITKVVWKTEHPQGALTLAAGPYLMQRGDHGDIQLLVLFSAANVKLAASYLESIRGYLHLYEELFGPYPYEKFAVVENFYPTGYGLAGWTLLGSSVVPLPFIQDTSLPHEIAHAWWGNAVEIDYTSGNWGEGLATYVADYYLKEQKDPREAIEYRRKLVRDFASLVKGDEDMPLVDFRRRMSKRDQAIGYGKATMVFHMLRELIGDAAFWQGLQKIAREGRGKRYDWGNLQRHFEAASGEELQNFFQQWLERTGAPVLRLADVDVIKVGSQWQVSGNIHQGSPVYDLAVPLLLETAERQYRQVVGLYKETECFVFTTAERPVQLSLDPDSSLFRQLFPEELPSTINDLRASESQLVVIAKGSENLHNASQDLLRGLHWHDAAVVGEAEYLKIKPLRSDVLILGWPEDEKLQSQMQEFIGAVKKQPAPPDKIDENEVLFMVIKGSSGSQVIAYYLPGSIIAAQDAARRIPHYGQYSYLTFKNGRNQVKGTWEPDRSPLKVRFYKD